MYAYVLLYVILLSTLFLNKSTSIYAKFHEQILHIPKSSHLRNMFSLMSDNIEINYTVKTVKIFSAIFFYLILMSSSGVVG